MSRYIDEHRERFGVEPICRTLQVSASAYYQRATGLRSERVIEDEHLTERIREAHRANYSAYGYRRMWPALTRQGENVGRDRVARLMRQTGIQGAKRRGKPWRTTTPDQAALARPDLVNRDFTANAPNQLWVADLTYTSDAGRASPISHSSSTCSTARSSAGSSPPTCAARSCSTP